ncbi:MAG: hypothetical protein ACOCMZ_02575 [Acetivibrio ethanolgignens]
MLKKHITKYLAAKQKTKNNCLKPFDRVKFIKNISHSQFELFFDYTKYYCDTILWDNIQRDIILSLASDYTIVVHLDAYQTDTSITELDNKIGELYPCIKNDKGEYFIEIMTQDLRLLTEIKNDPLLWECGNVLHIAAFKEKKPQYTNESIFDDAEFVIHSIYDNNGFVINVRDIEQYGKMIETKVKYVLDNYHILMEGDL